MSRFFMASLALGLSAPYCAAQATGQTSFSLDDIKALASDPAWLKLNRYQLDFAFGDGVTSDIVNTSFFLAEGGRKDPEAELSATIDALAAPFDPETAEEHALCRFPARAIFLNRSLGQEVFDPFGNCPGLADFANRGAVDSVSVLFIGSYLSNPGSAFGHLLLRFHNEQADPDADEVWANDVLERAVNYGAASSENDPMLPYVIKGLTGVYHSRFTTLDFFHHSERYREQQLRNIWEYKLDLEEEDVDFLVAHIWEQLEAENRYYFLRQNCAYRIAEAVELVVDKDLSPPGKLWVAPIDVFHSLMDGEDSVADIRRLKSRESEFIENYQRLSGDERDFVDQVLAEPETPLDAQLAAYALEDPAPALNVLLDRYAYAADSDAVETREREVLATRMQLPRSEKPVSIEPPPPHSGQRPSLLQFSALYNDELGAGAELRFRPVYFDFLSSTQGTVPYSELSMVDTRLIFRDDEVRLRSLEAIKITTLDPARSGMPNTGAGAWQVRFGVEGQSLACDDCLVGYGEAGVGRAVEFAKGAVTYGLVSGRLEAGNDVPNHVDAIAKAGLLFKGKDAALNAEASYIQGIDDFDEGRWTGKVEARLGSGERWDVRLSVGYDEATESRASLSFYW